ncbi:MAG: hypothetical protein QXP96_06450, partial [Thermoproteota archaeon]
MNSWWRIIGVLAIALLFIMPALPVAFAEKTSPDAVKVSVEVRGHRKYFNPTFNDYIYRQSFYLFGGNDVQWWQGGAVFIYNVTSNVAKQKIDILTRHMMELFKDLGFVTVAGVVKPVYVKIVYWFDGVILYEGLYFVDRNGTVTIEWSEGKPLVVTVNSIATINASTAQYLGRADWTFTEVNGGRAIHYPELVVEAPVGHYEFLVVPREGVVSVDEDLNHYGARKTIYLGGGPDLHAVTVGETVLGSHAIGYVLSDAGTFYDREPDLKILYD